MNFLSNRIAFSVGAIAGLVIIKQQPDGNLLVTSVFTLLTGTSALVGWLILKQIFQLFRKKK